MEKQKTKSLKNLNKFTLGIFIVMIVTLTITFLSIYNYDKMNLNRYDSGFYNVQIEGMYKIDDGDWNELTEDTEFNLNEHHTYYFKGHFNKDIPKNNEIMMRSKDLYVDVKVNGKYILGPVEDKEYTIGNIWIGILSDGITTDDLVEIDVRNVYRRINTGAIRPLLNSMYFGSADGMYKLAFKENGFDIIVGIAILTLGLCELLSALIMAILKSKNIKRIVYSGGFTSMAGIWIGIRYNLISLIIPYPVLTQAVELISLELLCLFITLYLSTYFTGKLKIASNVHCIIMIIWIMFTASLKLVWNTDIYRLFIPTAVFTILNILIIMMYLQYEYFIKKNKSTKVIIFFVLPIIVGGIVDCIRLLADLGDGPIGFGKGIVIAGVIQLVILIYEKRNNDMIIEKARTLENELIQSRISVMLSQIQPHCLYNSLNTIRYLCTEDAEKAEQAIIDFANFLRGNVDSLNSTGLITFKKELEHVEHYASLEKIRFGDRVNVVYDIGVSNFKIPPLTLQPIVENAIRYGITKKEEGGTVTIKTSETSKDYIITVSDDGVGFDINNVKVNDDKRTHVGIDNVRKRIIAQCNGSLDIQSAPNEGTTVILKVSKGELEYENNNSR